MDSSSQSFVGTIIAIRTGEEHLHNVPIHTVEAHPKLLSAIYKSELGYLDRVICQWETRNNPTALRIVQCPAIRTFPINITLTEANSVINDSQLPFVEKSSESDKAVQYELRATIPERNASYDIFVMISNR